MSNEEIYIIENETTDTTYLEVQRIYDGGNVARLRIDEIQTINNLKHAWLFILNSIDAENDLKLFFYYFVCPLSEFYCLF